MEQKKRDKSKQKQMVEGYKALRSILKDAARAISSLRKKVIPVNQEDRLASNPEFIKALLLIKEGMDNSKLDLDKVQKIKSLDQWNKE